MKKKKSIGRLINTGIAAGLLCSALCVPVMTPAEEIENLPTESESVTAQEADMVDSGEGQEQEQEQSEEQSDASDILLNKNQTGDGSLSGEVNILLKENQTENRPLSGNYLTEEEKPSGFSSIYLDLNDDGKTDDEDEELLLETINSYSKSDHNGQEVAGELSRMIWGPLRSKANVTAPPNSSYYLNNDGAATAVRDQAPFGACWAFSAVASLESAILKERQRLTGEEAGKSGTGEPVLHGLVTEPNLSEKYISWITYRHEQGIQDEGIITSNDDESLLDAGGLPGFADSIWTSWRGVVSEGDEPYRADNASDSYMDGYINELDKDGKPAVWSISDNIYPTGDTNAPARVDEVISLPAPAVIEYKDGKNVWTGYDENATSLIKQSLLDNGAVCITYAADQSVSGESGNSSFFNYKTWSQYNDSNDVKVNHSVTIVGWNDDYPAENFQADKNHLPPGNGAWLVKNSWGSYDYYKSIYGDSYVSYLDMLGDDKSAGSWGLPDENGIGTGYFWLSYYDKSITSATAFGVDIPEDGWDHDNIYQYDYFSDMSNVPFVLRMYDKETAVANIFTSKGRERLDAVSVRTVEPFSKVNVKIYLLDDAAKVPEDGVLVSEQEVQLELAGFSTLKLSEPVELAPGQRFAVVENVVSSSGSEEREVSFLNVETALKRELQTDTNMGLVMSYVYAGLGETLVKVLQESGYEWLTPQMLTEGLGGGIFEFGNALIKAFTNVIADEVKPGGDEPEPGNQVKESEGARQGAGSGSGIVRQRDGSVSARQGTVLVSDEVRHRTVPLSGSHENRPLSDVLLKENQTENRPLSGTGVVAAKTGDRDFTALLIVVAAGASVAVPVVLRRMRCR